MDVQTVPSESTVSYGKHVMARLERACADCYLDSDSSAKIEGDEESTYQNFKGT